jgi:hypothetical protein
MNPHIILYPILIACVAHVALWVCALVSIVGIAAPRRAVIWVVLTSAFPVLGSLAWFVAGRHFELQATAESAGPRGVPQPLTTAR